MSKKTDILFNILDTDLSQLSPTEIKILMNREIEKPVEEINTEFIDLCLEALDKVENEKPNTKRAKLSIFKVVLVAAIIIAISAVSITAGAKFFHINAPNGIVKINGDHFSVDMNNEGIVEDILGQLKEDGIEEPLLPEMLIYRDTEISNYQYESIDGHSLTTFNFKNDISGKVTIQKFNLEYDFFDIQNQKPMEVDMYEILETNGTRILVFGNEKASNIQYASNNCEYLLTISCDFETALEIAKTI